MKGLVVSPYGVPMGVKEYLYCNQPFQSTEEESPFKTNTAEEESPFTHGYILVTRRSVLEHLYIEQYLYKSPRKDREYVTPLTFSSTPRLTISFSLGGCIRKGTVPLNVTVSK